MQFHQFYYKLIRTLLLNSTQTLRVHNEIQFYQLHDLYESCELNGPLPHSSTGL